MNLVLVHARAGTASLVRHASFSIPTLLFPALLFLAFGASRAGSRADVYLASFAGFAVLGVAFFQFGVGIAAERGSPWERYLRTLPASPGVRFAARMLSALVFGLASSALVIVTALLTTRARLPPVRWLELGSVLLLGSVPFALLGIALGYWATPRGALPIANLLYLGLSFAGGLWTGGRDLSRPVAAVSPYVPTREWADLLWASVGAGRWHAAPALSLAAYTLAFGALALWGYRRDEGERYR